MRISERAFERFENVLLNDAASGGLVTFGEFLPSYLSDAGNDYGFATPIHLRGALVACRATVVM